VKDHAWARGMAELQKSGLPGWPTDPKESAMRAELYRRHLDDLGEDAWLHAVAEAVRHERWFPTVAALRDYAAGWVPEFKLLPPPRRTEEQLIEAREAARRGLVLVMAAVAERGLPDGEPVKAMPGTEPQQPTLVRTTATKRAELERQRQEIGR
jgi:hypothetical protein